MGSLPLKTKSSASNLLVSKLKYCIIEIINMPEEIKSKKEIIEELLLTEEDTLKKLKTLIDRTKLLVKIDQKTRKIVVSSEFVFSNPERILLLLIGQYFSKELGLSDTERMNTSKLEKESGIKRSTLYWPLLALLQSGYIGQDGEEYFIQHYKIEEVINSLSSKYGEKILGAKPLQIRYRPKTKRKKSGKK